MLTTLGDIFCRSFAKATMSSVQSVAGDNWQALRPTIRERSAYLFNNELLSDVNFVVKTSSNENDDQCSAKKSKMVIPAHKFVLAIGSPVFFAMFYGELAEKKDSIDVVDCEYESLLELFRFLYSDEVKFNPDNVMRVLYLAKKYLVPALVDKCIEHLGQILDGSNVFSTMDCSRIFDEKKLMENCWCAVDKYAEDAVKSSSFITIEKSVLEALVERDTLMIKEVELFKAVDKWATKECERQELIADGTVKRRILGERIVKAIRFPIMEQREFVAVVLDSDILTSKEVYDVMKYYSAVLTSPVGFPETIRVGNAHRCCRFSSVEESGWFYESDLQDGLVFSVSKSIKLYGVCLFGSQNNKYTVNVKISRHLYLTARDTANSFSDLVCKSGTFSSVSIKDNTLHYEGFIVLFDEPVVILKGISHCVKSAISGPPSWCGENGASSLECSGVTFNFKEALGDKNGTSPKLGQFPQFLFTIAK